MAILDSDSRQKLHTYFYQSFDEENAGTMDAFVRNFLHNGAVFDLVGDAFPTASISQAKAVLMEAYGAWQKDNGLEIKPE